MAIMTLPPTITCFGIIILKLTLKGYLWLVHLRANVVIRLVRMSWIRCSTANLVLLGPSAVTVLQTLLRRRMDPLNCLGTFIARPLT